MLRGAVAAHEVQRLNSGGNRTSSMRSGGVVNRVLQGARSLRISSSGRTSSDGPSGGKKQSTWHHDRSVDLGSLNEEPLERFVPDDSEVYRKEDLEKLCNNNEWQMRQIVVTHDSVMITHLESDMIIDSIPLYEVQDVARVGEHDGFGTRKRLSMASISEKTKSFGTSDNDLRKPGMFKTSTSSDPSIEQARYFAFAIRTDVGGFNSGRSYFFRTRDNESCEGWIAELKEWAKAARTKHEQLSRVKRLQAQVRRIYESTPTQSFIALLIVGNFVSSAFETQVNPEQEKGLNAFALIDLVFTVLFSIDLAINAFAHWFSEFIRDGWNWFDMFVVCASILSLLLETASGIKGLRMVRAFRVIRVVRRLKNLRNLINSLTASVFPVINAMCIVFLACCIYAVIGVNLFRERDELLFGSFARALFTMFQVSTMDGWAKASRGMFATDDLDPGVTIFFMSFIVIVTWTLLPVVVAVLLDNFTYATKKEKERQEEKRLAKKRGPTAANALDPLLASMTHYQDDADLSRRISTLFTLLDADGSGSLMYEEMVESLHKIRSFSTMHLSHEDFQTFTEDFRLCDESGGLTLSAFETVIRKQLKLYLFRQMDAAVRLSEGEDAATSLLLSGMKILIHLVDHPAASPALPPPPEQRPSALSSSTSPARSPTASVRKPGIGSEQPREASEGKETEGREVAVEVVTLGRMEGLLEALARRMEGVERLLLQQQPTSSTPLSHFPASASDAASVSASGAVAEEVAEDKWSGGSWGTRPEAPAQPSSGAAEGTGGLQPRGGGRRRPARTLLAEPMAGVLGGGASKPFPVRAVPRAPTPSDPASIRILRESLRDHPAAARTESAAGREGAEGAVRQRGVGTPRRQGDGRQESCDVLQAALVLATPRGSRQGGSHGTSTVAQLEQHDARGLLDSGPSTPRSTSRLGRSLHSPVGQTFSTAPKLRGLARHAASPTPSIDLTGMASISPRKSVSARGPEGGSRGSSVRLPVEGLDPDPADRASPSLAAGWPYSQRIQNQTPPRILWPEPDACAEPRMLGSMLESVNPGPGSDAPSRTSYTSRKVTPAWPS